MHTTFAQTTPSWLGNSFKNTSYVFQEYRAEHEEILRHKWLESEKLGYDIGMECARLDWIARHRSKWRQAYRDRSNRFSAHEKSPRLTR
ncbi:MAG: DUF4032 domain-containing protein [Puniceicoccales bacterium]|nr:DUF4032 domain-containing protein [Puniceicoccales bacterium]